MKDLLLDYFSVDTFEDYNYREVLRFLGRSDHESTHRVLGNSVLKVWMFSGEPYLFMLDQEAKHKLGIRFISRPLRRADLESFKTYLNSWISYDRSPKAFYRALSHDKVLTPLMSAYKGLPLLGIPDFLEVVSWAIIGQQINLSFAYQCKKRLVEALGPNIDFEGNRFFAFPDAASIHAIPDQELKAMQFSRQKILYLKIISEKLLDGQLDPSEIGRLPYREAKKELLKIKGIGPWTADYVLMKHFHFTEACPLSDAGLRQALTPFLDPGKPPIDQIEHMADDWKKWKALSTFYLWHSLLK